MDVFVTVEPLEGGELERLITVRLNATGVVRQMIERVDAPPDTDGVEIIDLVAERLHDCLSPIAEHYGDDELAVVTGILAPATLVGAQALGLGDLYLGQSKTSTAPTMRPWRARPSSLTRSAAAPRASDGSTP